MHTFVPSLMESTPRNFFEYPSLGLSVDFNGTGLDLGALQTELAPRLHRAIVAMQELEAGKIANPDENRMVGHYWLRNPSVAPTLDIRHDILETRRQVECFAQRVLRGELCGQTGRFRNFLLVGIGGSALGPQLVSQAFGMEVRSRLHPRFLDNTDPDGMSRIINDIGNEIGQTLCIIVSKSGNTKETNNGMIFLERAYERAGLSFEKHAVAITMPSSRLSRYASDHGWLKTFPIWDWVGGRTSFFSAVTLLPAALVGVPLAGLLAGGRACDEITRNQKFELNPALQMAAAWYYLSEIAKKSCLAIIPYKDSLEYLGRFLQQLVMESIGKEKDLNGSVVNKGIVVFGNKGSTDQHSYLQQLRDGIDNTFTVLVNVCRQQNDLPLESESRTIADYLFGFSVGTRLALKSKHRNAITVTIHDDSPFSIGVLIALFERIVGFLASLLNINAYHQPGVEAGKLAAEEIVRLKIKVLRVLRSSRRIPMSVSELSRRIEPELPKSVLAEVCEYLAANSRFGVQKIRLTTVADDCYFSI